MGWIRCDTNEPPLRPIIINTDHISDISIDPVRDWKTNKDSYTVNAYMDLGEGTIAIPIAHDLTIKQANKLFAELFNALTDMLAGTITGVDFTDLKEWDLFKED